MGYLPMFEFKQLVSIGVVAFLFLSSACDASGNSSVGKLIGSSDERSESAVLNEVTKETGSGPVSFETSDLDGLYQQLIAQNVTQLPIEKRRQLALLVLRRTAQEMPPKPDGVNAAKELLATILAVSDDDPEIAAIATNVHAIEAGMTVSPMGALAITKSVTRTLDRLVRDNPDNGGVLMQRGSNALYSPMVAGRGSIAVSDFEALVSGRFAINESTRWYLLELLGLSYQKVDRKDDARRIFSELADSNVPYWQARAQVLIMGLGR